MIPGHILLFQDIVHLSARQVPEPRRVYDTQVLTSEVSKDVGWRDGRVKKSRGLRLSVTRSLTPHLSATMEESRQCFVEDVQWRDKCGSCECFYYIRTYVRRLSVVGCSVYSSTALQHRNTLTLSMQVLTLCHFKRFKGSSFFFFE